MMMKKILCNAILLVAVASASTVYTGDTFEGDPVITKLDVHDLDVGSYRFWFRSLGNGIGEYTQVPVMIEKGSMDGEVLFLQSSLHGDELAGTRVIQRVFKDLGKCEKNENAKARHVRALANHDGECEKKKLTGTVVGIIGSNPNALREHSRNARYSTDGGSVTNLNRVMPGVTSGSDAGARYAYSLWNDLYGNATNPTVFLDLHTQSRGTIYPYFIYADLRNPVVAKLVQVMPADVVKDDSVGWSEASSPRVLDDSRNVYSISDFDLLTVLSFRYIGRTRNRGNRDD
jgi:uncharacterized protein